MKEIQAWLGHSTIGTTANIYTHLDENAKINSANAIILAFWSKNGHSEHFISECPLPKWCRQRESNPYGFGPRDFKCYPLFLQ